MTDPQPIDPIGSAGLGTTPAPKSNVLATLIIGVLAVMLIPMPTWVLDVLLTVNISLSLLIIIITVNNIAFTSIQTSIH